MPHPLYTACADMCMCLHACATVCVLKRKLLVRWLSYVNSEEVPLQESAVGEISESRCLHKAKKRLDPHLCNFTRQES